MEPADPLQDGELDGFQVRPGITATDYARLEQADHGFGQRIARGVADATGRWRDADVGQSLALANRQVLHPAVGMLNQPGHRARLSIVNGRLERIEPECSVPWLQSFKS